MNGENNQSGVVVFSHKITFIKIRFSLWFKDYIIHMKSKNRQLIPNDLRMTMEAIINTFFILSKISEFLKFNTKKFGIFFQTLLWDLITQINFTEMCYTLH